jgi:hypothetical protein
MHINRVAPQAVLSLVLGGVAAAITTSWTPLALAVLGPLAFLLLGVGTDWLPRSIVGWPILVGIAVIGTVGIGFLLFAPLLKTGRFWRALSYVGGVLWVAAGFCVWYIGAYAA